MADVSALVQPDSEIDLEARSRGANLYLPEVVSTMLPPEATDQLGLGLQEISPALSIGFNLNLAGEIADGFHCHGFHTANLESQEALSIQNKLSIEGGDSAVIKTTHASEPTGGHVGSLLPRKCHLHTRTTRSVPRTPPSSVAKPVAILTPYGITL